jgi:MFS transporter, PHS family, inorganic phosphate transporter
MEMRDTSSSISKKTGFRWRFMITAGVGFFADAYELFIMGVVTVILCPIWHLSVIQIAILNGASLASAAVGAVTFGFLSDRFGRKKLYGCEIAVLFVGALLSSTAQSFTWLILARIVVGLGIGGDYPSSAVVASEHSCAQRRGFMVLLVFAMQAVGLIFASLLASLFLATTLSHSIVWRCLLGFGMIPSASVFYLRRTIEESPHYARVKDLPLEASRVVSDLAGVEDDVVRISYKKQHLFKGKWVKYLIGTAGAWFLLDVAFYGNGVSTVMILQTLNPNADLLSQTLITAALFLMFAVPGYFLAAKYVDRIGRRNLQIMGFLAIAASYAIIATMGSVIDHFQLFFLVYGLSYFFINFGPNTTTFLIPSEIYPTTIRGKAHGISAAIGKVGAFVGAFFLPIILKDPKYGMSVVMTLMAIVSVCGIAVTLLLPEMSKMDLSLTEELG